MSDESNKNGLKNDALLFQFQTTLASLKSLPSTKTSSILESLIDPCKGISQLTHTNHIHNDSHTDHSESRPYHDKTGYGF